MSALIPQIRGNVPYTGYERWSPNVRNDAGMVGASDCRNRYSICPGAGSAGYSGSGDITGHHIRSAVETNSTCSPKCDHPDRDGQLDHRGPVHEQQGAS